MADDDPATQAASRATKAIFGYDTPTRSMVFSAQEALDPIKAVLDRWYQNHLDVEAGPGATLRSELTALDALAEIGQLAGWKEPE